MPITASPYFGSWSRIVCPPASNPPAARTCASAAAKISASISIGSSSGNAAIDRASSGVPPIAKTSFKRVRRRDGAIVGRVVHDRREEVEGEDERALVVQPVDRRVVCGREPDEQVLGLDRDKPLQELLQPRGRVLGGTTAARGEVGKTDFSGLDIHGVAGM